MGFPVALPPSAARFVDLREEVLLDYGYNTARAYWSDLQDLYEWATRLGTDVLTLSERDIRRYLALLRRRKYSEATIRRRVTAARLLLGHAVRLKIRSDNPAAAVVVKGRRP